jgi:hypothetical protein
MSVLKFSFKFSDSYTLKNRVVFFGRTVDYSVLGRYRLKYISPLQGTDSWCQMRWTMSIAKISGAYSAIIPTSRFAPKRNLFICGQNHLIAFKNKFALKGLNIIEQDNVLFNRIIQQYALKWLNIIEQDNVLFNRIIQ